MTSYMLTTPYETEVIQGRIDAGEIVVEAVVHRYNISTTQGSQTVLVSEETNDNNDDGIADGRWDAWSVEYPTLIQALDRCGKCRVGISGVIVTVTLDGEEVRG